MPALQRIDSANTADILSALTTDGGCIALNFLTPEVCEQLTADFSGHLDEVGLGADDLGYRNDFYGQKTKRLKGLFSKSARMEAVLTHPDVLNVARQFLLSDKRATDLRLSNAELMVLYPGQGNQDFHTDAVSWRRAQRAEKPHEILFSINIALTDFTDHNGATRVVPGSHLWAEQREPAEDEITLATMPRGSALFYTGNVIHSGGHNRSDEIRYGLYLGYSLSWLRPLENQLLTNDPEDLKKLSPQAQQLLDIVPGGFTVYA